MSETRYSVPDRQTGRLRNARTLQTCVCSQCGGILTEIWDERVECHLRVVCSQDHSHEGYVSKTSVEERRQRERTEGQELYRVFPELSGYTKPTQAEIDKDMTDLF